MSKSVTTIPAKPKTHPLRVAAYCRVSSEADEQTMSFESQVAYYRTVIDENPDWVLVEIYAECFTGTDFENRSEYIRMVKAGKLDYIITKSISRFGRNTLPLLKSLQELTLAGVTVYFQQEDLSTDDPEMQQPIRIAAALAQAESLDKSKNIKWGIQRNFEQGKVQLNHKQFLGYTRDVDGNLVIVPEEARIVRLIFNLYLQGLGTRRIKKHLEENGYKTVTGKSTWSTGTLDRMLENEKYVGDALLQKTYVEDFLTHKQCKNEGQRPRYYVENSHPAIISKEIFEAVQEKSAICDVVALLKTNALSHNIL